MDEAAANIQAKGEEMAQKLKEGIFYKFFCISQVLSFADEFPILPSNSVSDTCHCFQVKKSIHLACISSFGSDYGH